MKNLCVVVCLSLLSACGGTERKRTSYPVTASGKSTGVVTDSGWAITFTKAKAQLQSVRFFEGKVLLSRAQPKPQWWRGLLISSAYAHPGHYVPGEALGELVSPLELDLLATTPKDWGTADALTGEQGSLQLTFATGGLELEGTATKSGQTVNFAAQFAPPLPLEGVRSEHVVSERGAGVDVKIDLAVITSRMDFAQVGTGASPLDTMSPAFNGFGRGIEDTSSYVVTWLGD